MSRISYIYYIMIINVIGLIGAANLLTGFYYVVVTKITNKKRNILENAGGTLYQGHFIFLVNIQCSPNKKWEMKLTSQIFRAPQNNMVNENNFS